VRLEDVDSLARKNPHSADGPLMTLGPHIFQRSGSGSAFHLPTRRTVSISAGSYFSGIVAPYASPLAGRLDHLRHQATEIPRGLRAGPHDHRCDETWRKVAAVERHPPNRIWRCRPRRSSWRSPLACEVAGIGVGHDDGAPVRIYENLVRIETEALRVIKRTTGAIGIDLSWADAGNEYVPIMVCTVCAHRARSLAPAAPQRHHRTATARPGSPACRTH
jgi:hypothetical protein